MARTVDTGGAPLAGRPVSPRKVARLEEDLAAAVAKEEKRRRQLVKAEGRPKRERRRRKQLAKASGKLADLRARLATAIDPSVAGSNVAVTPPKPVTQAGSAKTTSRAAKAKPEPGSSATPRPARRRRSPGQSPGQA